MVECRGETALAGVTFITARGYKKIWVIEMLNSIGVRIPRFLEKCYNEVHRLVAHPNQNTEMAA